MTNRFKHFATYFLAFLIGAIFVLSLVLGGMYFEQPVITPKGYPKIFKEVKHFFDNDFYTQDEVLQKDLEYGMVKGFVEAYWDKHSQFFPPKKAQDFREFIDGDFEWIWAYVEKHEMGILIDRVIAGSPAKKTGITSGDIIISADENNLSWLEVDEAVGLIKWPKGSPVQLEIVRPGEDEIMQITVIRDTVIIPSAEKIPLERDDIVAISLRSFMANSFFVFRELMQSSIHEGTKGIIVDLRDNGGGLLSSSVDILGLFLEKGSVVVEIRWSKEEPEIVTTKREPVTSLPVVVLVNENSASASEIVAGAMQDYKRGIVIGNTTYGKGSVQVSHTLSDGSELKLTTDHWFTYLGRAIEWVGVVPDQEVEYTFEQFKAGEDPQLQAALEYFDD